MTDFSLEYDIAPVVIPPISEIEQVAQETSNFLLNIFEQQVPGLENLGLNYVGEDLSFPTYTIDYEVVVTVNDGTTKEELDAILNSAFQGTSLQDYVEVIQALPADNSFSRVTGIRKIDTPSNRQTNPGTAGESSSTNLTGIPVPLMAAAGAASFALIVLGITLNRREKAAMREGNPNQKQNFRDHMTVAGDTFAGETYAETINSANSKGGKSHSSRGVRAGYESAVRTNFAISSSDSDAGYGTESDYESGYEEEEKMEIDDDEDKSMSDASFSKYGGVVPVDAMHLRNEDYGPRQPHGPASRLTSNDALLRGVAAGARRAQNDEDNASMNSTIRSAGSGGIQAGHSTDSGSTSIHILEAVSSDDDDLKRASQGRQAFNMYYTRPGEIQIHIPSVETDDYEEVDIPGMDNSSSSGSDHMARMNGSVGSGSPLKDVSTGQATNDDGPSQRSFENITSQLGKDLQRELKREPEQQRPVQEKQPDPPQELPEEPRAPRAPTQRFSPKPKPPPSRTGGNSGVAALIQKFN